jgi:L-glyceraldehyde 3-phosphate reductase
MGLDYVDIFYHHRPDPRTPLEETMAALASAVSAGKALYVGVSSYSPDLTARAAAILAELGTPMLIHQPSYSMVNRWIESTGLLDTLEQVGAGCIGFSPLAQGVLTDKYLAGVPAGSRASQDKSLDPDSLNEETIAHLKALNEIASDRGQSLAQMALAWGLRDPRVTSLLVGASSPAQVKANVAALDNTDFSIDELAAIDAHTNLSGVDLWADARSEGDAALD